MCNNNSSCVVVVVAILAVVIFLIFLVRLVWFTGYVVTKAERMRVERDDVKKQVFGFIY